MTVDYKTLFGGSSDNNSIPTKKWWLLKGDERASAISAIVNMISKNDSKRQSQYQISNRLYGNTSLTGMNGLAFSKMANPQSAAKERITYNLVQSVIDTVTSKISKSKPKPLFLTSGGDYTMQRKAKKLDKFVDGIFYQENAYKQGIRAFKDGCVWGDGFTQVYTHDGKVCYDRVLASELFVDWVDGFYGKPRQIHRVKNFDRDVLADLFPKHKKQIMTAKSATSDFVGIYQNVSDYITVVESWKLRSGPDADDGVHCIVIDGVELFSEEWIKDFFPFANFKWSTRGDGFWGQGLAEQVQSLQLEVNNLLRIIQRSYHLAGTFKVFLENGSKIVKEHLNNDVGAIINYTGAPPQYVVTPVVPPEIYGWLNSLKQSAYEQSGISQLSASSQKPAGLNSGKALREYNDIESDRFQEIGQAYEDYYLQLAKLTVSCAKDIYGEKGSYAVNVPGRNFIEKIDWKDIDLMDDEFYLKLYPVSKLADDPADRLQTIQEYTQAGFMDPRTGRRLLDFPDLEQVENLANASEDYLNEVFEKMTDKGIYTQPEPFNDLKLARELALQYYHKGKCNNLDPAKLDLIITFMSQLDVLESKAQQDMQARQPQAAPVAQPTSDLVQNVPGVA